MTQKRSLKQIYCLWYLSFKDRNWNLLRGFQNGRRSQSSNPLKSSLQRSDLPTFWWKRRSLERRQSKSATLRCFRMPTKTKGKE